MHRPFHVIRGTAMALLLAALVVGGQVVFASNSITVTVLGTSDLHGHILPVDYFSGATDPGGLAQIASYVNEVRAQNPYTVLIDNGDTIEGGNSTLPVHYAGSSDVVNPMALAMNTMRYDSMTLGNHEFNFGQKLIGKFADEATFPLLAANVLGADGKPIFAPYVIKDFGQVQVGIVGVVTPNIPNWEKPENIAGLTFADPVAAAAKYAAEARAKGADVVIVAAHTGPELQPTDISNLGNWMKSSLYAANNSDYENYAIRIANGVPAADALIAGHSHLTIPEISKLPGVVNADIIISEPSSWGDQISRFDFTLEPNGSDWKITAKKAQLIPTAKLVENSAVVAIAKPYHNSTMSLLSTLLGKSTADFVSGPAARVYDSAIIELVNKAQMALTGADISLSALFTNSAKISKGDVLVKDIYGLYVYSNTLYKIEITGAKLRAALEQDATFWQQYTGQKSIAELVTPNARDYNWDIYSGIDYTIDISKPVGARVINLKFKGKDVLPDQKFTLAINNYRATGGGNFPMFKDCPILWKSEAEMREIMRDYVKANPSLNPASLEDGSFTLLPALVKTLPVK